jgi:hypothetical protein
MGSFAAMLLVFAIGLWSGPSIAAPFPIDVSPQGKTRLRAVFRHVTVTAEIVGHSLPVTSRKDGDHSDIRCTNSRIPCMLVDQLTIGVNGRRVDVPRSTVVELSDVDRVSLSAAGPNRYRLILECGDASEGYRVEILFDRTRVRQRDVIDGEAGMLSERTIYKDLSHAFDN